MSIYRGSSIPTENRPKDFLFAPERSKTPEPPLLPFKLLPKPPTINIIRQHAAISYLFLSLGEYVNEGDEISTGFGWKSVGTVGPFRTVKVGENIRRAIKPIGKPTVTPCFTPIESGYVFLRKGDNTREGDEYHNGGNWYKLWIGFPVSQEGCYRRRIS